MREHDFTIEEDNPITEDDQGLGYSGNGFTGV